MSYDDEQMLQYALDYFRDELEDGKFHLRVSSDFNFRLRLLDAYQDYLNGDDSWYVDPVKGEIYSVTINDIVTPWEENLSWRIVSIIDIVKETPDGSFEVCDEVVVFPFGE